MKKLLLLFVLMFMMISTFAQQIVFSYKFEKGNLETQQSETVFEANKIEFTDQGIYVNTAFYEYTSFYQYNENTYYGMVRDVLGYYDVYIYLGDTEWLLTFFGKKEQYVKFYINKEQ